MNYYYVRPQPKRNEWVRRLAFLTAAVVLAFGVDVLSHGAISAALRGVEKKWSEVAGAANAQMASSALFANSTHLSEENAALREEVARYRSLALSAAALQEQNAALAKTAHLALVHPGVTAAVTSSESSLGTFLVGAGKQDGVSEGDIVRADDGTAIATILSVQETSALARSVFAPAVTLEVTAGGSHFTLEGRGASNARGKAPRDAVLSVGDSVSASDLRGYPVGQIGAIDQDSAGAFQEVYVRFAQDISATRYVYIERP